MSWELSSFRHYATGRDGSVEVESEWRHENANEPQGDYVHPWNCPTHAKNTLEWATRLEIASPAAIHWCAGVTEPTLAGSGAEAGAVDDGAGAAGFVGVAGAAAGATGDVSPPLAFARS